MGKFNRLFGPAALLWPFLAGAQTQPNLAAIMDRLDRLERENRALAAEVRELRSRIDHPGTPYALPTTDAAPVSPETGHATAPGFTTDEKIDIQSQRVDELSQVKVESSQKFPLRLTGMALFNAFWNSREGGGSQYPATATDPNLRRAGASVRQTIIGLDFRGPNAIWGGRVHGSVYMDFFAGANNEAMRIRNGSIQIDWKSRSILAGLEKPIFNPREPSSLAQVGISPLTGAGNLWLWLPQVRFDQNISLARSTGVRARLGVVQTRESGPYPGTNFTGTVESGRPGFEGRFEFFHNFDDDRRLEIAPGFHASQTHAGGYSVDSRIFSMDWFYNPVRRVEFTGAGYMGHNVAPLGAGYPQGFGFYYGRAQPVHSIGGWGQLTLHTLPRLDFHLFSGLQDDTNKDLRDGRIGKNMLFGGNAYFRLAPNVIVAFEGTHLRTMYIGQSVRVNNHYDVALAYLF